MNNQTMNINPVMRNRMVVWLLTGCFLVFGMVVVGGITRLTGSGLSITEWKVITGAIPPLNETQWQQEFDKYKLIPQYREMNYHFTLKDFKFIYFWEYIHRLFGRMIGVVFLGGFIYFLRAGAIRKELRPKLVFMFVLGAIQGFLGWYMVSSGLTQNIRVSHIRLAIHLTFAFITFGYIFNVALAEIYKNKTTTGYALTRFRNAGILLLMLVVLQVIYGAFVAGTKAGWIYNTWPMMGDQWMADSVGFAYKHDGISSLINNLASVQFIHRCLAYLILIAVVTLLYFIRKKNSENGGAVQAASIMTILVTCQAVLGIMTLLAAVPIWMGVLHQALAFFVFASVIYFLRRLSWS